VQLIGAIVLHEGDIAEGRPAKAIRLWQRLRSTSPAPGKGGCTSSPVTITCPVATSEWMWQIYQFLEALPRVIVHGLDDAERKEASSRTSPTVPPTNTAYRTTCRDHMKYCWRTGPARHVYAIVARSTAVLDRRGAHAFIILRTARRPFGLYKHHRKLSFPLDKDRLLRRRKSSAR